MNAAGGGNGADAPAGALSLEVVVGKAAGFTLTVDDRLVIGRHSDGPGRLADDPELSRHHAQISRESSGEYAIEDLSSTNGTFVNGVRLEAPALLSVGDTIEVGGTTLVVRELPSLAAPGPAPEVDVRAATVSVDPPAAMRAPAPPTEPIPAAAPPEPEPYVAPEPEPPADAPPAAMPVADTAARLAAGVPRFMVSVSVDFERGEAEISLGDGGVEPLRLRLQEGRWRTVDEDG
jgi:pSer/pThr/pTyr-binding forkhead associated (FHA) protein